MVLTGTFVIWGTYYGVILAIEASGFSKKLKRTAPIFQHLYSVILIMVGWIFFRITAIEEWGSFFGALLGINGWRNLVTFRSLNILFYIPFLIPAILFSLPFMHQLGEKIKSPKGHSVDSPRYWTYIVLVPVHNHIHPFKRIHRIYVR
jgi:alginate O-acetyltransferase complex protein AlgI